MSALERKSQILDDGKDANEIVASLRDNSIADEEVVSRLIEAGVDPNEIVRVTNSRASSALTTLFEGGVDANLFGSKHIFKKTSR